MDYRIATAADADYIARLHAESWRSAYRGIYADAYLDGHVVDERLAVWRERFETAPEDRIVLLAMEGGALCGFVCAFGGEDATWGTLIDNLHVRPDLKRGGIGRRLMQDAAAWSNERYPGRGMYLWVLDGNANARRFYERLGAAAVASEPYEPPGGGSVLSWRYAWDAPIRCG